ncbi:uncharacterized protein LOC113335610 [Papaver somniferum]|uniref:uncharacterized protein LOC113335610 n=1 Tax=Papaver somniferum TaxID=3469 RepID=UPI000E701658|nr:uncharacterized protein LOC113335610 [Papaver somniferum]
MDMILEYSSTRTSSSSSPIETLIFNYVTSNFGILFSTLDNFWDLIISVLSTAVISLWGIKIVSSISHHQHVESDGSPSISFHHNQNQDKDDDQKYTEESVEEDNVFVSSCSSLFDEDSAIKFDGNVKRKFTLHFAIGGDEGVNFNDELTAVTRCWNEVDVSDVTAHLKEDYCNYDGRSKWEKVLVTKDLGWYSNLDLTSLDGSAVKLWETMRR